MQASEAIEWFSFNLSQVTRPSGYPGSDFQLWNAIQEVP